MEKRPLSEKIATTALYFIFVVVMAFGWVAFYGCRQSDNIKIEDIYQKQSNIDPRKHVLYDKKANHKGFLQQSRIDPRVTVQRSKKGNIKGYWKQDPVDPRKMRFYKRKK